ncbi:beta-ketoacyl synthase [Leptospira inadai serovar Lyme str. 10]|uniref:Beta-ketoacyl synthase n=3 Tax=Leptospira inadai TaxID=29506 RepID=V6HA68_9LEPT|nr:beta-ketoacyl synthase [Leptospira inadai serovar Lyme str. 10]PNV72465.1 type I polyketide synthase [Leptospira inadai serovar Lyme]
MDVKMKANYTSTHAFIEEPLSIFKFLSLNKSKVFSIFGGQGSDALPELRSFYEEGNFHKDFFDAVFITLEEEFAALTKDRANACLPHGFHLSDWLKQPELTPTSSQLSLCSYSVPLIFITQAAGLFRFLKEEGHWELFRSNVSGICGHSQGVYAGLLLSVSKNRESFLKNLSLILRAILHLAIRSQEEFPLLEVDASYKRFIKSGEHPSPMAALQAEVNHLVPILEKFNSERTAEDTVYLGLQNSERSVVLCGSAESLLEFREILSHSSFPDLDSWIFLNISAPFHCQLLRRVPVLLEEDLKRIGFDPKPEDLEIPLYDTRDGKNLKEETGIALSLARMVVADPLDWKACTKEFQSGKEKVLLLSFGPGTGIDKICASNFRGKSFLIENLERDESFRSFQKSSSLSFPKSWEEFAPEIVRLPEGKEFLRNAYSVWAEHPPVFGGGMTPSTVEPDIVIAAAKEGYLVEWAGGGQVTEEIFRSRMERFRNELPAGKKIVINLLYLDAYLWNLQVPLVKKLKSEGAPIEGVTISAGIPDTDEAIRIIKDFESHGIWLNSFKPGTKTQIQQVISIAKKIPESTILMQIEGGAAGGHHSWEDLEELVGSMYAEIRNTQNLILSVGGGIAEPEDARRWLFGTWAKQRIMPVDAVFLGTRLMSAKECATSDKIKQSLVDLSGSIEWQTTKDGKIAGGVLSGRSGLGADIYYAHNTWTKVSALAEELTKGKEPEEARQNVLSRKEELISLIDSTAKPYFGDLEKMTYTDVLSRYIELTCPGERLVSPEGEWPDHPFIDRSFRSRLEEILHRFEERILTFDEKVHYSILTNSEELKKPEDILNKWKVIYPNGSKKLLLPEDRIFFLDVCKRPGKPVNFIPVLDEDLVKWIRSDSLWYSHCIGMDPDACAWIPGPKAVSGIRISNQPVASIFSDFINGIQPESKTRKIDWSDLFDNNDFTPRNLEFNDSDSGLGGSLRIPQEFDVNSRDWIRWLARLGKGFLSGVLSSPRLGREMTDLPLFFEAKAARTYSWEISPSKELILLRVYEGENLKIELRLIDPISAQLEIFFSRPGDNLSIPFKRRFYLSADRESFINEDMEFRNKSILDFYSKSWKIDHSILKNTSDFPELNSETVLDRNSILNFRKATGELRRIDLRAEPVPSLGMGVTFAWKILMAPLFAFKDVNLFKLLHLSQSFKWGRIAGELKPGDRIRSSVRLAKASKSPVGTELLVTGTVYREEQFICSFETGFLIRGSFGSIPYFDSLPIRKTVEIKSIAQGNVVLSLPWITKLQFSKELEMGSILRFSSEEKLRMETDFRTTTYFVEGKIEKRTSTGFEPWGTFKLDERLTSDQTSSLDRFFLSFAEAESEVPLLKSYRILSDIVIAPSDMGDYSAASGDTNPIHTDNDFARIGGWDRRIVHGLWTSSQVLKLLTRDVCGGDPARLLSLDESFEAPVYLQEELRVEAFHISQLNGNMILEIKVENRNGESKLSARATIAPPKTGYVFTGQGSQSQGMGLKLMEEFSEARKIWERAEKTVTDELGFSLLEIVRDNPISLRVGGKTWTHPKGVLHLTQFTQVALVTKSMADWEILKGRGYLVPSAPFAGHSLGEFSSLSARGFLGLENVIRIVYGRGLTMQELVPRDSEGRSPYGMSVVLGNRHVGLTEERILEVVEQIRLSTGLHLEVVNLNIRDKQYSVTGDLKALSEMEAKFKEIVRGKKTTIRLEGIDVPFHSRVLVSGVAEFRHTLESNVPSSSDFSELDGTYIPNLVAKPFSIQKEFLRLVSETSGSPILSEILINSGKAISDSELRRLLLIELLAYQFAMPVQWIKTQDVLFDQLKVRRLIDLGARGDLAGMARQTIREVSDHSTYEILHVEENRNSVFYESEDVSQAIWSPVQQPIQSKMETASPTSDKPRHVVASVVESEADQPSQEMDSAGGDEASVSLDRKDALLSLLSLKAGVRPDEISEEETVDSLFGGNSSKRNQVMADLGAEFRTPSLDGGHEKPIRELNRLLSEQSQYTQPGPYLRTAFEETLKKHFPPDFGRTEVFRHLKEERGLSESGIFAISVFLPLFVRDGESIRKGPLSSIAIPSRIGSAKEAARWLDKAVDIFAQSKGIRIHKASSAKRGHGAAKIDAAALEELERKYFGAEGVFGKNIRDLRSRLLGEDPFAQYLIRDLDLLKNARERNSVQSEIPSIFDEKKIVAFRNSNQWAKKKLLQLLTEIADGRRTHITLKEETYLSNHRSTLLSEVYEYWSQSEEFSKIQTKEVRNSLERSLQEKGKTSPSLPIFKVESTILRPRLEIADDGGWNYSEEEQQVNIKEFLKSKISLKTSPDFGNNFDLNTSFTNSFEEVLSSVVSEGISFTGRKVLVTGAGPNSIALETVQGLLAGGADVVLTTTSYSPQKVSLYKRIFQEYGSPGASLQIVPFSQGSLDDIRFLSEWLTAKNWEPDLLLPFGAIGEENAASQLDSSSLVSLQVMLLGVEKLIGVLGRSRRSLGSDASPLNVILPLSPNHGIFGKDGLYAETKLGLEALFRKKFSESEDWGKNTRIIGCVIGWVRGTGLMEANDLVAEALERETDVFTFSKREMGTLISGLAYYTFNNGKIDILKAYFTGGLESQPNLGATLAKIRSNIILDAKNKRESSQLFSQILPQKNETKRIHPLPKEVFSFPSVPTDLELKSYGDLTHLDPANLICVVGFAEIGPGGNSVSRWELEKSGILSLEGALELAWTMGLVKYQASDKGRSWTDAQTGEAIQEWEAKSRYEKTILENTGIRFIDASSRGFDPNSLISFVDVVLQEDFFLPVSNGSEAEDFHRAEPDSTEVYFDSEKDKWFIKRKKGSLIKVKKALGVNRKVAGQIPKGWDPIRYGLPKDLTKQVDEITLYNLYCTCEAFLRSGMEPLELYAYLHPGLVGSTVGSGMGGMSKMKRMFQDFLLGQERQHDALQESLINVTAAWALTSYVGAYGPVQTPVAACATAGVSLEMAMNIIRDGKARFMLAGAFDDFSEEGLIGFGDMQATADSVEMEASGIAASGICRPNDIRRNGFVEAHGGGVVLLARGDLALQAGLPVYGILAYAGSKTDGIQASIPAPGLGLLSLGAESKGNSRVWNVEERKKAIASWNQEKERMISSFGEGGQELFEEVQTLLSGKFQPGRDGISPIRSALAVFGLTADDIGVAYKHDTSTKANDKNENKLLYSLLSKLGRTQGNLLPIVSQKSLTGHSKGGAAAWQTVGVLQTLEEGIVAGNRNLEEVDPDMNTFPFLTFTDESIRYGKHKLKAGILTTLGFGHVGALCLLVHSDFFLAALSPEQRQNYLSIRNEREIAGRNRYHEIRMGIGKPMYERKTKSYFEEEEVSLLLDSSFRKAKSSVPPK